MKLRWLQEPGLASTQPASLDDEMLGHLSSMYDDPNNEFDFSITGL